MSVIQLKKSFLPVAYDDAVRFMEQRVQSMLDADTIGCLWLLEHPPLLTAGTSASLSDLSPDNILPIHQSARGGKHTYHGPGQRIAYVMLNLKMLGSDVRVFVKKLESWVVGALEQVGLSAGVHKDHVGIWVPSSNLGAEAKIAAIGLRVRKWVSYHGVAINVCPNLNHFQYIVPCGIKNLGVTSLKEEGIKIDISSFDDVLVSQFCKEFKLDFHESA